MFMLVLAALSIGAVAILKERFAVLFLPYFLPNYQFFLSVGIEAVISVPAKPGFNPVVAQLSFEQSLFLGHHLIHWFVIVHMERSTSVL